MLVPPFSLAHHILVRVGRGENVLMVRKFLYLFYHGAHKNHIKDSLGTR